MIFTRSCEDVQGAEGKGYLRQSRLVTTSDGGILNTWWIDDPWLLGSCNPTTQDLSKLHSTGFGVVVSLLDETEQQPKYDPVAIGALGVTRHNISVKDFHAPTVAQLNEFISILKNLAPGAKVLVHCEGGSGRTGTFAATYWISKGLSSKEAIAKVRLSRQHAIETDEQRGVLEMFARVGP